MLPFYCMKACLSIYFIHGLQKHFARYRTDQAVFDFPFYRSSSPNLTSKTILLFEPHYYRFSLVKT